MAMFFLLKPWEKQVIKWDISLYYTYLPAAFIYNDLAIQRDWPADLHNHQILIKRAFNGKHLIKMSSGMAITYLPWFLMAHAYALLNDTVASNGFSQPYHFAIAFGAVIWCALGSFFLLSFLCRFTKPIYALLTILLLFAGTNLFFYTFYEGAMSHSILFALLSICLELSERYLSKQRLVLIIAIGFLAGLMILIRPIFILPVLALFLFYGFKLKWKVRPLHIIAALVAAFIVILPQLLYWHLITGKWIFYSYVNEHFFFTDPKIWKGLFSWRKGWFVFTPIMLAVFPAFIVLIKKKRDWFWLIVPLLCLYIYVIFSWWCWWYGGSFGMRALIEFYPLLAIPIALLLAQIGKSRIWLKLGVGLIFITLAAFNIFTTWQYNNGIMHFDSMTKRAHIGIFLKTDFPNPYEVLLDHPDYEAAQKGLRDQ